MPRAPRIDIPGLVYHLTARGVKRLPIFGDDQDRQEFLRLLRWTRDQFPFTLHAYCLMTNHYHLLLQTGNVALADLMQSFKTAYAKHFNRRHHHVGHVFQGRYHSIPVQEDAYFTTVARYIHLNPVKAGIVTAPQDFPWSDYPRLIKGEGDPLVESQFLLGYFGRDIALQREKYRLFVEDGISKQEPVTEKALYRMRFWGAPPPAFRSATLSQIPS